MSRHVNVELKDGSVCQMAKKSFNVFLSLDRVVRFKRAEGWVDVASGQLRDLTKLSTYPAMADRRAPS